MLFEIVDKDRRQTTETSFPIYSHRDFGLDEPKLMHVYTLSTLVNHVIDFWVYKVGIALPIII